MAEKGTSQIRTIGVVGCGLMGAGIVEVCARKGYSVVTSEISEELLEHGMGIVKKSLARGLERGKLTQEDHDAALGLIKGTTDYADFGECDLVIEAVPENVELKKKVFATIDEIVPPHAIIASNTSSISLTTLAAATNRPDQVIGLHFFNPVPVMKLLEIVKALQTSEETFARAQAFGEGLGKTIVVAEKDNPGFIVNLLFIPYGMNAIRALEEGVATKEDFDTGMKLGMGHPMGPFELMDFVGLDTMLNIADAMLAETGDSRYAAPPMLRRLVAAGHMGRKSGRGFYDYSKK